MAEVAYWLVTRSVPLAESCTDPVVMLYLDGRFGLVLKGIFQKSFQGAVSPQWSTVSEIPPAKV